MCLGTVKASHISVLSNLVTNFNCLISLLATMNGQRFLEFLQTQFLDVDRTTVVIQGVNDRAVHLEQGGILNSKKLVFSSKNEPAGTVKPIEKVVHCFWFYYGLKPCTCLGWSWRTSSCRVLLKVLDIAKFSHFYQYRDWIKKILVIFKINHIFRCLLG